MKYLLSIMALGVALSSTAFAASDEAQQGRPSKADREACKAQMKEKAEKRFQEQDANKDGQLSFDEFIANHQKRMKEHFERIDENKDGQLTKEELQAGRKDMFKRMKERGPKGERQGRRGGCDMPPPPPGEGDMPPPPAPDEE